MYVLKHGKFISGSRIYRSGDVLPDSAGAQELVKMRLAEAIETTPTKKAKATKIPEPTSENAKVDS